LEYPAPGQPLANLYLKTDSGVIDILPSILGVGDYERLRQHAVRMPLFGRMVSVISMDDLIAAKEAVGREKDLLAVKELRAIAAKRAQRQPGSFGKKASARERIPPLLALAVAFQHTQKSNR
jgi:hypothetical protein